MPPRNPSAGKRPANAHVGSYTRADGTRVRAHNRTGRMAKIRAAWSGPNGTRIRKSLGGAAVSGTVCVGIALEFGFTTISTAFMVGIAILTALTVLAGALAEANKKTAGAQAKRRTTSTRRTTARPGTRSQPRRRS